MTPPKLDLAELRKVCGKHKALPNAIEEVFEVIKHFTPVADWDQIMRSQIRLTFEEALALSSVLLKLAEEKQKEYHKGYDDGVTGQPRKGRPVPSLAAKKGDSQ